MRARGFAMTTTAAVLAVSTAACGDLGDALDAHAYDCEVVVEDESVDLNSEQAANAATIAAVGLRRDVPEYGIVVALATAQQESKLSNIDHGDRDSVGLFQQRPSQGWGTAEEIKDPQYAATKFYERLEDVEGWEDMRVTDAAQEVQQSAYPEEYEKWADDSEIMTEAFTGNVDSALSCRAEADDAESYSVAQLSEALLHDWGEETIYSETDVELSVPVNTTQDGWQYASWLVAHAGGHGVSTVYYDGLAWDSDEGAWAESAKSTDTDYVVARIAAGE
ncbi:MAG: hypothetical protein ACRDXX_14880 [Stackebrandtia sp.]